MGVLKVHFPSLRPDRTAIDLAGALGALGTTPASGRAQQYEQFNREASRWFALADIDEADVIVYPYRADSYPEDVAYVAGEAAKRHIGCVFMAWGDADVPVSAPHGVVYRHSLFADRKLACERAMPAFCADPLVESGGVVSARAWQEKPSVGFCGFVSNAPMRSIYRLMGRNEKALGLELRARVLNVLGAHPGIDSHFVRHNAYWAGTAGRWRKDPAGQERTWQDFVANLLDNDYNVCVRGAGNFSYRLYEILAAGRIPIFVNTKCVLPFDDEIVWRQHCVWVEENQINRAGDILAEFHAGLSPERFGAIQAANRRLWESRLSRMGFYRYALGKAAGKMASEGE